MRPAGWLLLAGSFVTGVLNYGYTLFLIFLLRPADFSKVASIASLLLLTGTAAAATIPWVLAREISNSAEHADRRRRALGFALIASTVAGIAAGTVLSLLEAPYAGLPLILLSAVTCMGIFITAVGAGYLQGQQRLSLLAVYRLVEVVAKVAFGVGGAVLFRSAEAGVAGFAVGSVTCSAWALWIVRRDIGRPDSRGIGDRSLWRHAGGIGAVQVLCALQQAIDIIVLSLTVGATPAAAGYQGMLVLGRIPVFISTALSIIAFPRLAAEEAGADEKRRVAADVLKVYLLLSGAIVVVLVALPENLLGLVLPEHYLSFDTLLLPLAVAGALAGLLNLLTTFLQAAARYRAPAVALAAGVAVEATALALNSGNLLMFAWIAETVTAAITMAVLFILVSSRQRPDRPTLPDGADTLRTVMRRATRTRDRADRRVLMFGNFGNGNTGDESILTGLLGLADRCDLITVVSRNPDQITRLHGVPAVRTLSRDGVRAFWSATAITIGGGGIFGRGLPPLVRLLPWLAIGARLMGKELYFLSLGAYTTTPWSTKIPLQLAARLATAVTVRDPQSQSTMTQGLAHGTQAQIVPDPSLMVVAAPREQVARLLAETSPAGTSGPPLLINVKAMPDRAALQSVLAALGRAVSAWARTNDNPIYVIAMSTAGDYGLGEANSDARLGAWLIDRAELGDRVTVLGPNLEPSLMKGLHAQALGVVAMRLHSQIFATTTGAPLLGISFEPKSRLWLAQTGAEDLPADTAGAADIEAWLHRLSSGAVLDSMARG